VFRASKFPDVLGTNPQALVETVSGPALRGILSPVRNPRYEGGELPGRQRLVAGETDRDRRSASQRRPDTEATMPSRVVPVARADGSGSGVDRPNRTTRERHRQQRTCYRPVTPFVPAHERGRKYLSPPPRVDRENQGEVRSRIRGLEGDGRTSL